ncbi:MAG: hemerythrin family protein [Clostridiales bacterium]|nr:hemerythrin family protein [Clostridiales bacterium]
MVAYTDDLKTFIPSIDEQHEELLSLLNNVEIIGTAAHTKEETEKALEFLGAYIEKHLSYEEELMVEYGYPEYSWHVNWHDGYINQFKNLKGEYAKNGPSPNFTHILTEFLMKWVITHIRNVDTDLGHYIRDHARYKNSRKETL